MIATALMTLMVNARHLFYGISMLDKYKNTGKYKPYLIFSLTDETYSLVCSGEIPEGDAALLGRETGLYLELHPDRTTKQDVGNGGAGTLF